MGSDTKTSGVSMARVGEQLKDAREKKSVTIDQVQEQTRIHSTVLKALEEGRCDAILNPTYVRSFLKKYAEYLGLDARQMLGEYTKMRPAQQAAPVSVTGKTEAAPAPDLSKYFPAVKRAVVAIAVIAAIIFVGGKAVNLFKAKKQARPMSAVKSGRTVSATAKRKASSQPQVSDQKQPAAASLPIPRTSPLKLQITVKQTASVKVRVDGDLVFSRVLTRGSVESFTAKDRINIATGKGEAIELSLNGKSLGSPGRGPLKDIEVTRNGLKIK